ncbi:MAG: OmpH family outer membrane protein [Calditrichaeota bacterium]|nr:MAG: OmpH family outer membrane protein [Calditrichota bacterium]
MNKTFTVLTVVAAALLLSMQNSWAQVKIRYVDSQRILNEYPEAQAVQKKLDEIRAGYEAEFNQLLKKYDELNKELESQSLLLSPEKKAEKERELQQLASQIEQYRYEKLGPQGEFYKKNLDLTQPLYDKIQQVIRRVGEQEGYDLILDVAQGVVLYAKPEYDITDRILEELNKSN